MRIIGGKYKGRKLRLPKNTKTRPTTDFAKEALFNYLDDQFTINGSTVLDVFAGSGSLGFEFLSRGAAFTYFVEIEKSTAKAISETAEYFNEENYKCIKADAHKIVKAWRVEPVNFIIADPPFSLKDYQPFINSLISSKATDNNTVIIIEHSSDKQILPEEKCLSIKKYGQIMFTIFKANYEQE